MLRTSRTTGGPGWGLALPPSKQQPLRERPWRSRISRQPHTAAERRGEPRLRENISNRHADRGLLFQVHEELKLSNKKTNDLAKQ